MAKTEQEIRGKVGNMVFYKVGNEIRVRSTANDFQDADSEGQHPGRSRLRVATLFYQRLRRRFLGEYGNWRRQGQVRMVLIFL